MTKSLITFESVEEMNASTEIYQPGTVAMVDNQYYIYNEGWHATTGEVTGDGLQLNLYELNRNIITQMGPLDEEGIQKARRTIANWLEANNIIADYYLMYGKESSYFTLFNLTNSDEIPASYPDHKPYIEFNNLVDAVMACLESVGELYSVDVAKDANAIEIWVKWSDNDVVTCMFLFDYTEGIVYVQK